MCLWLMPFLSAVCLKTENVEYPPRSPDRLFPVGCSKEYCLHLKTTYTARPEVWNWNCMFCCSISNNTERLSICCTSSVMHCCCWWWWWTFWKFVTSNVKISQFCRINMWIMNIQNVYIFFWPHCSMESRKYEDQVSGFIRGVHM
jgi:hypothetical protein